MTLKELNEFISGNKMSRCFMIFKDNTFEENIKNLWTPTYDGYGNIRDNWSNLPELDQEVTAFMPSGWQTNIFYIVLK